MFVTHLPLCFRMQFATFQEDQVKIDKRAARFGEMAKPARRQEPLSLQINQFIVSFDTNPIHKLLVDVMNVHIRITM